MYKVVIPPALAILFGSFLAASIAAKTGDADLMRFAWGMAAFSGMVFVALLAHFLLNGLRNIAELEKAEIKYKEYERKQRLDVLNGKPEHSGEYIQGFAEAARFFIRNYLAQSTCGPTEKMFYEHILATGTTAAKEIRKCYIDYMVMALCRQASLSDRDYAALTDAVNDKDVYDVLARVVYSPLVIDEFDKDYEDYKKQAGDA